MKNRFLSNKFIDCIAQPRCNQKIDSKERLESCLKWIERASYEKGILFSLEWTDYLLPVNDFIEHLDDAIFDDSYLVVEKTETLGETEYKVIIKEYERTGYIEELAVLRFEDWRIDERE